MTAKQRAQHLLDFIDNSPSPWHVVASIETAIQAFQFVRLDETAKWGLQTGGRYYVVRDDSSIVLFVLGRKTPADAARVGMRRTPSCGVIAASRCSDGPNGNAPSRAIAV